MPRTARIDAPGALHHVICRGIERRTIFINDMDRDDFVKRFAQLIVETETQCFAWALVPNHFHLLLKTGSVPLTTIMRRLLTGYAVGFNRRHKRTGRLFQNRYKSILCQEELYLTELVRYIHLNPLRAGIVSDLNALDRYPYSGHSRLMGRIEDKWQAKEEILSLFGEKRKAARRQYRLFVEKGISQGRRPEITGGGLLRSAGGWGVLKNKQRMGEHLKGDERILGDSDFVQRVLAEAEEHFERRYKLKAMGITFDALVERVADLFDLPVKSVLSAGKQPPRVQARSVVAYWAVKELCMDGTAVGRRLNLSQSAVSRAVHRGERIVDERCLLIIEGGGKCIISSPSPIPIP